MSKNPSIFLTGGSGLLAVNWFFTKRSEYNIYLGLNKREINPIGANIVFTDFSSEAGLLIQLQKIQPTLVIHTAGLTNVEKCENNPELAFDINVGISSLVAKVTRKLDIPMVHISTDHLFDGRLPMLSEEEPIHAINVYGKTKALAEKAVLEVNPKALIIRTNFYGWGTSYRKSFSDHIIETLRNIQTINLFDDVYYTPILMEKLIQTVHDLLLKKATGIYNVVSDDRVSKYEFGVLIAEKFGFDETLIQKCTLRSETNLVVRPLDMSLSNSKVRELLGRNLGTVKQHLSRLKDLEIDDNTKKLKLL
jgi:dTDP-4-dehydrorhamnose reductase